MGAVPPGYFFALFGAVEGFSFFGFFVSFFGDLSPMTDSFRTEVPIVCAGPALASRSSGKFAFTATGPTRSA